MSIIIIIIIIECPEAAGLWSVAPQAMSCADCDCRAPWPWASKVTSFSKAWSARRQSVITWWQRLPRGNRCHCLWQQVARLRPGYAAWLLFGMHAGASAGSRHGRLGCRQTDHALDVGHGARLMHVVVFNFVGVCGNALLEGQCWHFLRLGVLSA